MFLIMGNRNLIAFVSNFFLVSSFEVLFSVSIDLHNWFFLLFFFLDATFFIRHIAFSATKSFIAGVSENYNIILSLRISTVNFNPFHNIKYHLYFLRRKNRYSPSIIYRCARTHDTSGYRLPVCVR